MRKIPYNGSICWTEESCFKWIIDISYDIKEVLLLYKIVQMGILDGNPDSRKISTD
jgi:hypothetical protein